MGEAKRIAEEKTRALRELAAERMTPTPSQPSEEMVELASAAFYSAARGIGERNGYTDAAPWEGVSNEEREQLRECVRAAIAAMPAPQAEVERALLQKVLDYREGRKPFDFHRLPDDDRANVSFDAWCEIEQSIRAAIAAMPAPQAVPQAEVETLAITLMETDGVPRRRWSRSRARYERLARAALRTPPPSGDEHD